MKEKLINESKIQYASLKKILEETNSQGALKCMRALTTIVGDLELNDSYSPQIFDTLENILEKSRQVISSFEENIDKKEGEEEKETMRMN